MTVSLLKCIGLWLPIQSRNAKHIIKFFSFVRLQKKNESLKHFYLLYKICIHLYILNLNLPYDLIFSLKLYIGSRVSFFNKKENQEYDDYMRLSSQNLLLLIVLWSEIGLCDPPSRTLYYASVICFLNML